MRLSYRHLFFVFFFVFQHDCINNIDNRAGAYSAFSAQVNKIYFFRNKCLVHYAFLKRKKKFVCFK